MAEMVHHVFRRIAIAAFHKSDFHNGKNGMP